MDGAIEGRGAAREALAEAERVRGRAARSGRWFGGYLAVLGVGAVVWITVLEMAGDGAARNYVSAGGALVFLLAALWAERRAVFPVGASRTLLVSAVVWFGLYLVVIGPMVRWKMDTLPGWIGAATVMALPFFFSALRAVRRS